MASYRCLPNRFIWFVLLANRIAALFLWLTVHYCHFSYDVLRDVNAEMAGFGQV